jgi:hypothetical protein
MTACTIGVSTVAGAMALTSTLWGALSTAITFVKAMTAALVAA